MKPDKLDDFLRNAVGSYSREPSEKVWNGISGALFLNSLMKFMFSYGWIVLVLLLAGGSLFLVPTLKEERNQNTAHDPIVKSDLLLNDIAADIQNNNWVDPRKEKQIVEQKTALQNIQIEEVADPQPYRTEENAYLREKTELLEAENNNSGEPATVLYAPEKNAGSVIQPGKRAEGMVPRSGYALLTTTFDLFKIPERKTWQKIQLNIPKPHDYVRFSIPGAEVSYMYEFTFIDKDAERKKLVSQGFEVLGRFSSKDWHLSAGAGLMYAGDNGMFDVRFNQYDSVGYYFKVKSFTIDPQTGDPDFSTVPESVYDTVYYSFSSKPENLYTYLVLPVYGGINAYRYKRFGIDLEAGLVYSILVSEKEKEYAYTNDKALSINISNRTPSRIKAYGQISLGTALTYDIFSRFSLHLSPYVKYHLKPMYEKRFAENRDVWTFGIKTGIIYKLKGNGKTKTQNMD